MAAKWVKCMGPVVVIVRCPCQPSNSLSKCATICTWETRSRFANALKLRAMQSCNHFKCRLKDCKCRLSVTFPPLIKNIVVQFSDGLLYLRIGLTLPGDFLKHVFVWHDEWLGCVTVSNIGQDAKSLLFYFHSVVPLQYKDYCLHDLKNIVTWHISSQNIMRSSSQ